MIEEISSSRIGERCFRYTHSSGMTVFMCPMEGYSSVNAQLSVRFGALDDSCRIGERTLTVPDGTAHYLEHKLFESPETDAFALFAETGAFCNAATSYDNTYYYFSCAQDFERNLEILLDFVQHPYFTPENVEKERGIIEQEITMYQDNPSWRILMNLLEGVYSVNPIRKDIAGSRESIAEITDKLLYDVYETFYNPSNMYLSIAGSFDMERAVEICEKKLLSRAPVSFEPTGFSEPAGVASHRVTLNMPVGKPQFMIGFKRPDVSGMESVTEYIYYDILFDLLFGSTSEFYLRMRDSGAINDAFYSSIFRGRGYMLPIALGESDDPDAVLEEMKKEIRRQRQTSPDREMFSRIKKASYGNMIRGFNNVETVSHIMTSAALAGVSPYAIPETVAEASYEEVCRRLAELDEENSCISIIYPL